ncbi:POTRA domain-containing protein [Burkholderia ubonensis]|uniref:POTRA domain-containing protein n=1 Tax=Burkholderia ubonensis TaxID=101571 RepID=UPI000A736856|nr:POTRA domain-containing protein [Burkholderia ubonensis]
MHVLLKLWVGAAVLFVCMAWLAHRPVHAHTLPPGARPVQSPAPLIIEQQCGQARQRQLKQPLASITITPTSETTLEIPPGTPVDAIVETGPTFPVQRIVLQTSDGKPFDPPGGLSWARLEAVVAPFVGHDLGSHRVNVLLKRLTDVFVEAGFVTTRALLGPRRVATGTLKVTMQVGRIASFMVNDTPVRRLKAGEPSAGGGWLTDAGDENAFLASPGDPLRLSYIDQGVAQINRMRRIQATV